MLSFILHLLHYVYNSFGIICRPFYVSVSNTIWSAYIKIDIEVVPILTPIPNVFILSAIELTNIANSEVESFCPCLTPGYVENHSVVLSFNLIVHSVPLYKTLIILAKSL